MLPVWTPCGFWGAPHRHGAQTGKWVSKRADPGPAWGRPWEVGHAGGAFGLLGEVPAKLGTRGPGGAGTGTPHPAVAGRSCLLPGEPDNGCLSLKRQSHECPFAVTRVEGVSQGSDEFVIPNGENVPSPRGAGREGRRAEGVAWGLQASEVSSGHPRPRPRSRDPQQGGDTMRGDAPPPAGPPASQSADLPEDPVLCIPQRRHPQGGDPVLALSTQPQSPGGRHRAGRALSLASPSPAPWGTPTAGRTSQSPGSPPFLPGAPSARARVGWAERAPLGTVIYFRTKCITPRTCQVRRPTRCRKPD